PAAGSASRERERSTPEHREARVQIASSGRECLPDRLHDLAIPGAHRIGDDQRKVDVADERAEAAVSEAAERVCGQQPSPESLAVGPHCLLEYALGALAAVGGHAAYSP